MIPPLVNRLASGLLAGAIATIPMTVVMQKLHRWPYPERDSLPPHQITKKLTARVGVKKHLSESQLSAVTLANHFGYGAAMGGLYSLLFARMPLPRFAKGMMWGLLVWLMSYLGWLPAANILPPATEHSNRRNILMIVAHLVWGVFTALLTSDRLDSDSK